MELAMATGTAPGNWWDEPDEVLATAIQLLNEQARKGARRGRRG